MEKIEKIEKLKKTLLGIQELEQRRKMAYEMLNNENLLPDFHKYYIDRIEMLEKAIQRMKKYYSKQLKELEL